MKNINNPLFRISKCKSISKKEIIDLLENNNLKVKSDDIIIKNQIKSIGEHIIEINPYEGIIEEFSITVSKK